MPHKKLNQYRVTVEFIATYEIDVCASSAQEALKESVNPYALLLQKTPISRKQVPKKAVLLKERE